MNGVPQKSIFGPEVPHAQSEPGRSPGNAQAPLGGTSPTRPEPFSRPQTPAERTLSALETHPQSVKPTGWAEELDKTGSPGWDSGYESTGTIVVPVERRYIITH